MVYELVHKPERLKSDPESETRQRFLDEIIGRPTAGPVEKLQVIKQEELDKPPQVPKTPAEAASSFQKRAYDQLDKAHSALNFTNDRFEPRVLPPLANHQAKADQTPTDIAKARLGTSASDEQIKAFANIIIKLNKLDNATTPDTKLGKDMTLRLPGQRTDGALTYRSNGVSVAEWSDNSSVRITERGRGFASFTEKDGTKVQLGWNPERVADTGEIRTTTEKRTKLSADGSRSEEAKTKDGKWALARIETKDGRGRDVTAEFNGTKNPDKITLTDPSDKSVIKLKFDGKSEYTGEKLNEKGEVVQKNVHAVTSRSGLSIFWENEGKDGGTTRTYENGTQEDYNKEQDLVERRGKDAWGRKIVERYDEGEALPFEIKVKTNDKDELTFTRQPFGQYTSPYKDKDGKEIGTVDLRRNGLLVYNNEHDQTASAELPDGTKILRRTLPDAKTDVVETKDGATLHRTVDRQGTVIDAEYTSKDGRKIYRKLSSDGSSVDKVVITDKDKAKTELAYDRDIGLFTGDRRDQHGKVLEKCFYYQGKIVYTDSDNKSRFEKLNFFEKDLFGLKISPGTYDALTGTITQTAPDGSKIVESFSPGRVDVVKDGTVNGTTITGERSAVLPTGEAVLHNPDESGVRLNKDGSVDRWGHEDSQNAQDEPLTRVEGDYLRKHPNIDRRDVLAIHAAYHEEPAKLDAFYKSLSKLDDAKNFTADEKAALRKDLMHHVGFPAEIYQGNTWCCNVAVCERDMAMNHPEKYADLLIGAISEGKVKMPDGTELPTDKCNLKAIDSSGRDFASRAFQTLAIHAKNYPKYSFANTEDGVGRLTPTDATAQPAAFAGLNMDDIAAVRYKLSGEKKAVVAITSAEDLFVAWNENKSRSMTIAVNADEAPFTEDNGMAGMFGGQTESSPNHVVSITRLEEGPPAIAYVQNQWGLRNDLSTPDRAVPVETLLKSMIGRVRDTSGRVVQTPAQALTTGEPTKTYFIQDGKLVQEKRRR